MEGQETTFFAPLFFFPRDCKASSGLCPRASGCLTLWDRSTSSAQTRAPSQGGLRGMAGEQPICRHSWHFAVTEPKKKNPKMASIHISRDYHSGLVRVAAAGLAHGGVPPQGPAHLPPRGAAPLQVLVRREL